MVILWILFKNRHQGSQFIFTINRTRWIQGDENKNMVVLGVMLVLTVRGYFKFVFTVDFISITFPRAIFTNSE